MPSWFAVTSDGAARRVGSLGLVIGRAPTSDIVVAEPEVSRRHLLLQPSGDRLDVVPLPGARTEMNGTVIEAVVAAKDGDVLTFPGGATIRLSKDDAKGEPVAAARAWLLDVGGRRIGLRHQSLVLGGGDDDVMIENWPAEAARISWRGSQPWFEPNVEGIARNDAVLPRGVAVALAGGDRLAWGQRTLDVIETSVDAEPTHRDTRVTALSLEMLPTGGMVTVQTTHGEHRALLAERRFALVVALVRPPEPYTAGEYVPDEVVFGLVWPRSHRVDRSDLNQLVHRLRADFKSAGLGLTLVERYAKGGATRIVLPPGATVTIR